MLVYYVRWTPDKEFVKGRTSAYPSIDFSVLCRCSSDAIGCLESIFKSTYVGKNVTLSDGDVLLKRAKIDSRNFDINYIFMDGIRQPLSLQDLKRSLFNLFPTI